jgi:hypothetical protein
MTAVNSPKLRLDAEVNESIKPLRLTIYFSHADVAESYEYYLKTLGAFYKNQDCRLTESGKGVSMNLPSNITPVREKGEKDVVLDFKNDDEAISWERDMKLWTTNQSKKGSLLYISRILLVYPLRDQLRVLYNVWLHNVSLPIAWDQPQVGLHEALINPVQNSEVHDLGDMALVRFPFGNFINTDQMTNCLRS